MSVALNPYLSFRDSAREAMTFYQSVFGGDLTMGTFAEFGVTDDPAEADKIMHSQLDAGGGLVFMAADTPNSVEHSGQSGVSISLSGTSADEDRLRGWWAALSDGGTVVLPLEPAPWGDVFGMCVDRFGTSWMVDFGDGPPAQG